MDRQEGPRKTGPKRPDRAGSDDDWLMLRLVDGAPGGILDAAPDAVLSVDDSDLILSVNRQVESLFGYHREQLIGHPVHTLLPSWPITRSDAPDGASARLRGASQAPRSVGRKSDGSGISLDISMSVLHTDHGPRTVVVVRASTAVPDAAEIVLVSDILESAHDAVWVVDAASLRLVYANDGLVQQLGYRRRDLMGIPAGLIAPEFADGTLRPLLSRLQADTSRSIVHRMDLRRADGTGLPVEVRTQAVARRTAGTNGSGGPGAYVSVARDLGDRAQEEMARHEADVAAELAEERARIGRDLHDGVIQRIFAAAMAVQALGARVAGAGLDSDVAHIVGELDGCVHDLRSVVEGITPGDAVDGCLRGGLMEVLVEQSSALALRPTVRFNGDLECIDGERLHHIVAIFREALSNIARHAHASRVDVLAEVTDSFLLRVSDDGVGFDAAQPSRGRGLRNLTHRGALLGGSLTVHSSCGGGTVVECLVPLSGTGS